MSDKSTYAQVNVLTGFLRTAAFTKPSTVYVALRTDATTEVTGGSYARVQVGPSDATWSDPAGTGISSNVGVIQFADATANWGTVTHFALMDAVSGGNELYSAALDATRVVNSGDTGPRFDAGDLTVQET